MEFSRLLARNVISIELSELPPIAIREAKRAIADTIGVALAGCREDFVTAMGTAVGVDRIDGCATVFGRSKRSSAPTAALINGISAHALDYDDCSVEMGGHPSAPIVPAILALAEERGLSGADVIQAYVAGFEAETRLARAMTPSHYEKGWHPTATLGLFGAAAACGRLAGLNEEELATALSIAVSMANGVKANFGTPVKPLQVGRAAQSGLLSVLLAEAGISANRGAFEHKQGFFRLFDGEGAYQAASAPALWAENLSIMDPGISIKQHPCCGSAHSVIDAAAKIYKEQGAIEPESVDRIEVSMHERRLTHTDRPEPKTALEAKFSTQFLACKTLLSGAVRLNDFHDNAFLSSDVSVLLKRVSISPHSGQDEYLASVRVALGDGRVLDGSESTPLGRDKRNPMSNAEFESKFLDCTKGMLTEPEARKLLMDLLDLEHKGRINEVAAILRSSNVT